jgi:hypothetical protein
MATSSAPPSTTPPPPPPKRSILSGRLAARNGPVLAVKIDNTRKAHPQRGLRKADVVYIEQVEGGATRLAAVYSSAYPRYVGPVRSARITDIELLRQYGTVKMIYSGAQRRLIDNLQRAKLRLVSFDADHAGFSRGGGRTAPYDVIGDVDQLRKRGGPATRPRKVGYAFGGLPSGGKRAHSVRVTYPFCTVSAQWSARHNRWLLWMDGAKDMAAEGGQLGPSTFIVQFARITASDYHDVNGANTPQTHTVGAGKALIFRNGKVFKAHWKRKRPAQPTTYTIGRRRAVLAPGQIWIALTRPRTVSVG